MARFAANLTMMFTEVPFLDRFTVAAAAGFRAVEYQFRHEVPAAAVREALEVAGLELALFNAPAGDFAAGERGLAAVPGQEDAFRAAIDLALADAEELDPGAIHVMAGLVRGEAARRTYVENLKWAAARAGNRRLTIEPINSRDMPGYHLSTTLDAEIVLQAVGAPNLGLQLDLYHCQIMEGDLTRRLTRLMPKIGHIQIAGVPDRHEPDRGELNLGHLCETIDGLGYRGWIGCEYHPAGRTEEGLGWLRQFDRG